MASPALPFAPAYPTFTAMPSGDHRRPDPEEKQLYGRS
jgi:hypothetical protein